MPGKERLKLIFHKNNLMAATDPKICTIKTNISVRVDLKYEGWIVQIFVVIGGFALFLSLQFTYFHSKVWK